MKYSLIRIRYLIKYSPTLVLMIVLSQIVAILSVYFSVGFINNSLKSKQEARHDQLRFNIFFYEINDEHLPETAPDWKSAKGKVSELFELVGDDLEGLSIIGGGDNPSCQLYSWISSDRNTRAVGAKNTCYADDSHKVGEVFTVCGINYTVINTGPTKATITINYDDYPDAAKVGKINISLNSAISHERINEISAKVRELFPETMELVEPEPETLLKIQIDNMFIFTSAFILLIAVVNISVYFSFLFRKREKQTAIFKICGASSFKVFMINNIEMLGSFLVSLAFSLAVFESLLPDLSKKYKGFSLFDDKKYIAIFAVTYFLVSAAVSVFLSYKYSSSSPVQSYKRAQKGGV